MTHEETIKRIQELTNGMALEFGCEVIYNQEKFVFISGGMAGKATIFNERCHAIHKSFQEITILGKPITLAVIMLAFGKTKIDVGVSVSFRNNGELAHIFPQGASLKPEPIKNTHISVDTRGDLWNLSKDNFNDQSEETKSFIRGLLGN